MLEKLLIDVAIQNTKLDHHKTTPSFYNICPNMPSAVEETSAAIDTQRLGILCTRELSRHRLAVCLLCYFRGRLWGNLGLRHIIQGYQGFFANY